MQDHRDVGLKLARHLPAGEQVHHVVEEVGVLIGHPLHGLFAAPAEQGIALAARFQFPERDPLAAGCHPLPVENVVEKGCRHPRVDVDVRIQAPLPVHAEILAQDFQDQAAVLIAAADPIRRSRKIGLPDSGLHGEQEGLLIVVDGVFCFGCVNKTVDDGIIQFGALSNVAPALIHGAGKRQAGFLAAFPAVGFIQVLEYFDGVFGCRHRSSPW